MPQRPTAVNVVESALALGFSLSEAIQRALGRSLASFAATYGHRASEVSMCLNAYEGRVYPAIRNDLATELGIGREVVDQWIDNPKAKAAEAGGTTARPRVAIPAGV